VTLRAEIGKAIDGIAPPAPELRGRALEFVHAELKQKGSGSTISGRRRRPFYSGLRHTGAIAAVLIVVLLVVAFFIGGRILQDWRQFNAPKPVGIDQAVVDQLRARAIVLPVLKPSDPCPSTPSLHSFFQLGDGPVYAEGGPAYFTTWGAYYDVSWYTDKGLTGPVLIRGRDLRSDRLIIFVGQNAAGPIVGSDVIKSARVDQRSELVLDAGHPPHRLGSPLDGVGYWPIRQGVSSGWSHCFGFQIDGPTFHETITGPAS